MPEVQIEVSGEAAMELATYQLITGRENIAEYAKDILRGYIWILKEQTAGSVIIAHHPPGEENWKELASMVEDEVAAKRYFLRTTGNIWMSHLGVVLEHASLYDARLRISPIAIMEALKQTTGREEHAQVLCDAVKMSRWILEEQTRGGVIIAHRKRGDGQDCPLLNHVKDVKLAKNYFMPHNHAFLCS